MTMARSIATVPRTVPVPVPPKFLAPRKAVQSKTVNSIILLSLLVLLGGCASTASKNDSWIGRHWSEYNQASIRGECYPAGAGVVSCYLQDWTVDTNGIITGWRSNSRQ
jgi:hypothetical protein